jgi:uncharacterized protein YbjT (DUF2867 family)
MTTTILVAGATGDLGRRIVRELTQHDVRVRVLTRPGSRTAEERFGDDARVDVVAAEYGDHDALTRAVSGADVVVSAVSGTRPVIVDAQRALLAATVAAGVRRFIPSDYSADYRRIAPGTNRNFELRREFAADLDAAPVHATSILTGMFTDLLTGDQVLDFTTKDDVARVTALAALDDDAPRVIEMAGDQVTARDVARTVSELTGERFRLQWAGTTGTLSAMSAVGKRLSKDPDETFPAWQGMQYFVSMFSGQAQLRHVDNDRYGVQSWTSVRDVLRAQLSGQGHPATD